MLPQINLTTFPLITSLPLIFIFRKSSRKNLPYVKKIFQCWLQCELTFTPEVLHYYLLPSAA